MLYTNRKGAPVQKLRNCLVLFALVIAIVLSCGIPTSMPILPKEVVVKASPSVSVPLGRVNYNLYSGISGGNMGGKLGGLDNLLGAGWLQDLLDQGAKIYDYRPAGLEDDPTQKFLIHYKLDMEDTMGSASEIDMSEYKGMLDDLTKMDDSTSTIKDVSFTIDAVTMTESFEVNIAMGAVTGQISENLEELRKYTAYLPVMNGNYEFPNLQDFPGLPSNTGQDFSVTLPGLDSLTLTTGTLSFDFTLTYVPVGGSKDPGANLKISGFTLQSKDSGSPLYITESGGAVDLNSSTKSTGDTFIKFNGVLSQFDLVCNLAMTGVGAGPVPGYFELQIEPKFEYFEISGVEGLKLEKSQWESLYYTFEGEPQSITDELGGSFQATVGTGDLKIDAAKDLFPPLPDPPDSTAEGWNLEMDLSGLYIEQGDSDYEDNSGVTVYVKGLALGESKSRPPVLSNTDLQGQFLNNQDVIIGGAITMEIPGPEIIEDGKKLKKLTFQNFPRGIIKGEDTSYNKTIDVNLNVFLFSTVTVKPVDIGMGDLLNIKPIKQDLGSKFAAYKEWLNYIQFEDGGLGALLTIETLNIPDGLGLYVDLSDLGIVDPIVRPLRKTENPPPGKDARLAFTNEGIHRLIGKEIPDPLEIRMELRMQDPEDPNKYIAPELLTLKDVDVPSEIKMTGIKPSMVFDWARISVKPKPPEPGGEPNDILPEYPFKGTYPDKEKGEEGIDLSGLPTGLVFPVPGKGEVWDEDGRGMSASLYLSLKRQQLVDGVWVDEGAGDPASPGYETDPHGWRRTLRVNLPSLDFRVRYDDDQMSENLFTYNPGEEKDTGEWALFRSLDLEDPGLVDQSLVGVDSENADNPFKIYTGSTLPAPDKAIPLGNLAEVFNKHLLGEKDLYFDYTVDFYTPKNEDGSDMKNEDGSDMLLYPDPEWEDESREPGEIILYPNMLEKRIAVSADLLIVLPLKFTVLQTDPDPDVPVVVTLAPDLGDGDLFGRQSPDDNEYFDMVKSLGFDLNIKNLAGLNAGRFFLESKTGGEPYRTSAPIVDFSHPQNTFSLGSEELETIKGIWPFIPRVAIEFEPGKDVLIERNFNIELQSITIKAGGEYTFETGW
jgi:hypothetical protein